jgi:hypothetical protein
MSLSPRFFKSVSTLSQNLAPSASASPIHNPSSSLLPSQLTPRTTYPARLLTRPDTLMLLLSRAPDPHPGQGCDVIRCILKRFVGT